MAESATPAVVLVHGGFVDGSGREGVYKVLTKDGYYVSIVQNPTLSLADDVAATKRIVAREKGPVILRTADRLRRDIEGPSCSQ